jgi:hypothetical protein
LVGPDTRTCLQNGFYSEFPPVCRCKCSIIILLHIACCMLRQSGRI